MKQERHELQFPKVPRNTEENQLTSCIRNEPETLAVDEKLCAELADVEANPLGALSLPGLSDVRKKRVEQLAFILMMQTNEQS